MFLRLKDVKLDLELRRVQRKAAGAARTTYKFYAILVMFAEGVHRLLLCGQIPETYGGESPLRH
jgi:hypothetical protein